jgi:hypothetical protein
LRTRHHTPRAGLAAGRFNSAVAANSIADIRGKALAVDAPDTVRALRAEMEGMWGGVPPAPDKFIDLSYCERALRQAR